jgi:ABC-type transport system involved in multi-copper enzyme maturation permease subunit
MIWLTWRQLRVQAVAVYAAAAAFAVVLVATGGRLVELARTYPASVLDQLTRTDRYLYNAGLVVLALAPAVIGAFWGAPMVARELEAGTHRLVWTQTVTRTRWLAGKLGITALAGAAVVGVLALAVTWWAGPLDGTTGSAHGSLPSRVTPVAFAMRGVVPVAYTVFALVLGVAVGLVLRRTVAAMAVTLVLFTFVQIAVPLWVRPHLLAPARQTVTISDNLVGIRLPESLGPVQLEVSTSEPTDWILADRTVDASGRVVPVPSWVTDCVPPPGPPEQAKAGSGRDRLQACLERLDALGYREQVVYQPASRFWALQWVETALFLGVAGLLAWFCFWWTRRRLS